MPVIKITDNHVSTESYCAVCKEAFELDFEAREIPCKHIYHSDCIFPWLSIRNSCPVFHYQLPTDLRSPCGSGMASPENNGMVGEEKTVGLTIWRLPGGGFAVGRFTRGRRAAKREFPIVYTEMDGGFNRGGFQLSGCFLHDSVVHLCYNPYAPRTTKRAVMVSGKEEPDFSLPPAMDYCLFYLIIILLES
ncbi:hypothetical protein ACFX13_034791 [Malus domestica]